MMPECLYWIALALLVLPSVPFNRVALVVLASWAFGHFAHITGPYENLVYMFAQIVACGAALGLWVSNTGERRSNAQFISAILFSPMAAISGVLAAWYSNDPQTMREYYIQLMLYWTLWSLGFVQAASIPSATIGTASKN